MKKRINALRQTFDALGLDGFIVTNQHNCQYLSGFTGDNVVLLITPKEQILITDFRYIDQAAEESPDYQVVKSSLLHDTLAECVTKLGLGKLAFEEKTISYMEYQSLHAKLTRIELVSTSNTVEKIRQVKDPVEIDALKKAAEIADKAFKHVLNLIKPGLREDEIAAELEYQMKKLGSQKPAFDTIIASGVRSSLPHGMASSKMIAPGDFVTIDFGAVYQGYHSDMTRTLIIGEPDEKQKLVYDLVLKAQTTALEAVKPGLKGSDVDHVARKIIADQGYGDCFGHGLGHSVGLEIHEKPSFSTMDHTIIEPGMVMTVEPGIYITGWGGVRIEDLVVVTDNGCEILSLTPKHLIQL